MKKHRRKHSPQWPGDHACADRSGDYRHGSGSRYRSARYGERLMIRLETVFFRVYNLSEVVPCE